MLKAQIAELEALLGEVPAEARPAVQRALEDARRSYDEALARIRDLLAGAKARYPQPGSP